MMIDANPITIAPRPILTSAFPLNWANNAPAKATMALEITRPNAFIIGWIV